MKTITVAAAIEKYSINENLYESVEMFDDVVNEDGSFYLHEGDLVLDEHFILDTDALPKNIEGYIINGNLTVKGNIINEEGDYGPALYVNGNVTCVSLLIGGSPTHITGDVTASEVIMLHYNHGWMKCPGLFKAPVMIVEDYHFVPAQKDIPGFYYNDNDSDMPEENENFEDETGDEHMSLNLQALLNNNLTTTFEEIRYDLAAGESVLMPVTTDEEYWERKVKHNYRDLKRVPMEMRTKDLCMAALRKSVSALEDFPPAFITQEVVNEAVNISGLALRYLPETFITRELCYKAVTKGALIDLDIPERYYEAPLLELLIQHSDWQMERVPAAYITEDLLVIYVKSGRGAWLERYCTNAGVSKQRVLQRVIEDGIQYVERIFTHFFSAETYGYSKSLYENEKEWPAILAQFQRKLDRL